MQISLLLFSEAQIVINIHQRFLVYAACVRLFSISENTIYGPAFSLFVSVRKVYRLVNNY